MAVIAAATPAAAADRGIQFTPNGEHVLANKDVPPDRWALTLNQDDGTATGNVFRVGGGPPAFIACNPTGQPNGFACFGADACSEGGTQRGIQQTPDGQRVLVNKDVGPDRWAITLNVDDGTAIGNIFRADGGDPAFVSCNPTGQPNAFACFGADACTVEPCDDDFSFIANVTLPASFFQVPNPCTQQFTFLANVTLPDDFFRLSLVDDFLSDIETDTGTEPTLRVGAAPIPGSNPPSPIAGVEGDQQVDPGGTSEITVNLNGGASSAATTDAFPAQQGLFLIVAVGEGTCSPADFVGGFYEIPLLTTSGQIAITITFGDEVRSNFLLCVTVVQNGVVGAYFGHAQNTSTCGNGAVEPGEACDPPASQAQCQTGRLCSNDCRQCVLATSCAGRCCPGRDDTCTAPSAPCFCDEFCVTANDCCEDALMQCGFGPGATAPTISGLTQELLQLNTISCMLPNGPVGSLFAAEFNFSDPDGDVTTMASAVEVSFQFVPSGNSATFTDTTLEQISGNASSGRVQVGQCYRFGNDQSVNVTVRLQDDAGHASNALTINTPKPQGAN